MIVDVSISLIVYPSDDMNVSMTISFECWMQVNIYYCEYAYDYKWIWMRERLGCKSKHFFLIRYNNPWAAKTTIASCNLVTFFSFFNCNLNSFLHPKIQPGCKLPTPFPTPHFCPPNPLFWKVGKWHNILSTCS